MPEKDLPPFQVDNATLIFRNFAGRKTGMNREGKRTFCVILDDHSAETMARDGWAVKYLEPREEGDTPTPFISVTVNFDSGRPPRVQMISSAGATDLDKETVKVLDFADIAKADLICNPYFWEMSDGKSGVSAYLKTLAVTINEDELERRYNMNASLPEILSQPTEGG